jgi:AcrR family transcriptional regulator
MAMETTTNGVRKPGERRVRRSETRHRAILEAAAAVVRETGYAGATVEGVAARAGAGKQTIYRWWPSKAALYLEVYTTLVPTADLQPDTGRAADDLIAVLARLFLLYRHTPAGDILAGLIADSQSDPAAAEAVRGGLIAGRRDVLTGPIERGVARGELPAGFDAIWASDTIVARLWHRLLTDRRGLDRDFAECLVRYVLAGRRPQAGPA